MRMTPDWRARWRPRLWQRPWGPRLWLRQRTRIWPLRLRLWPLLVSLLYEYDNGPSDGFGDITSDMPPLVEATPPRKPIICKETVTVPSEDGGTRQIRMIRC